MKTYLVVEQAVEQEGWQLKEYNAEAYFVDDARQLHLSIGDRRVASFAQGTWIRVAEMKEDKCCDPCN